MFDWEHQQQLEEREQYEALPVYCDYLAHIARTAINQPDPENIVMGVSIVKHHVMDDKLLSHTKRINVVDCNGRHYKITVEAI